MRATITLDTRGFAAAIHGIESALTRHGELPRTDLVLRNEIGAIVEKCVRSTKIAKADAIKKLYKAKGNSARAPGIAMSVNSGIRGGLTGRVWYGEDPSVSSTVTERQRVALKRRAKKGGKVWTIMEDALNPGAGMLSRFQRLDAMREANNRGPLAKALAAALGARGLARASWVQIANKLGIAVSVTPAQVLKAVPSTGVIYQPGNGARGRAGSAVYYDISNNFPFQRFKIDGARILSIAIQGRINYFNKNMEKSVFEDLSAIARRYPGLGVA
jgi:hypothetical protein